MFIYPTPAESTATAVTICQSCTVAALFQKRILLRERRVSSDDVFFFYSPNDLRVKNIIRISLIFILYTIYKIIINKNFYIICGDDGKIKNTKITRKNNNNKDDVPGVFAENFAVVVAFKRRFLAPCQRAAPRRPVVDRWKKVSEVASKKFGKIFKKIFIK